MSDDFEPAKRLLQAGEFHGAIALLSAKLQTATDPFPIHALLAVAYQSANDLDRAIDHAEKAVSLQPGWAEGYSMLGTLLARRGLHDRAVAAFERLVALRPGSVEALNNLGTVLKAQGNPPRAIEYLREAIVLRPDLAEIRNNLGNALFNQGETVAALAELELAVRLRPDLAGVHAALGNCLLALRRIDRAVDCFKNALQLQPNLHVVHQSLLLAMHYSKRSESSPAEVLAEHRLFARRHASHIPVPSTYANERSVTRRLRVGYCSPDFRTHSVAYFVEALLAGHDHSTFEVFCYCDASVRDETTARLETFSDHWRDTHGLDDGRVAEMIHRDRIDILIDLTGHTAGGRMLMFARHPAPVQITYLGYPGTTGLATMDYRLTDSIVDPPEADARHTEKLIRLAPPFLCYSPPVDAPAPMQTPASRNGFVTFGSFNTLAKLSAFTTSLWSQTLSAVPSSKLLLKARGLQQPSVADELAGEFAAHGITRDRLILLGHEATTNAHLSRYHEVDVALDTFPYNGTTTTCEALWMGVPAITLTGRVHASRVSTTLLHAVGRPGWVAKDAVDFVRIARGLADEIKYSTQVRTTLREQMHRSTLCDGAAFVERLQNAYRECWDRFVRANPVAD